MDFETAAYVLRKAREYTNEQRNGYSEIFTHIFNGDMANKVDIQGLTAVKISDEYLDFDTLRNIEIRQNEQSEVLQKSELVCISDSGLALIQTPEQGEFGTLLLTAQEDFSDFGIEKGLYVIIHEFGGITAYASRIEYETIHPIDPKFIPGYDNRVNLFDYGIQMADLTKSTFVIPQGKAFWDRLMDIRNAGFTPEIQIISDNYGQTTQITSWMYQGGETPLACSGASKTLSGTSVVDAYIIMQYDEAAGTVTVLHNLS